jgi:hypothetical protein
MASFEEYIGSSSFIMCLFRKINFDKNCQKKRFWEKKKQKKLSCQLFDFCFVVFRKYLVAIEM